VNNVLLSSFIRVQVDLDGNKVADMEIQLRDFGGVIDGSEFLL
jgi:hypothetical protein